MTHTYVIRDDWHYIGSAPIRTKACKLDAVVEGLDNDGNKILVKPALSRASDMFPL